MCAAGFLFLLFILRILLEMLLAFLRMLFLLSAVDICYSCHQREVLIETCEGEGHLMHDLLGCFQNMIFVNGRYVAEAV